MNDLTISVAMLRSWLNPEKGFDYKGHPLYVKPYQYRDTVKGHAVDGQSARAGSLHCLYCKKQIMAWGKKHSPGGKRIYRSEVDLAWYRHEPDCALKWAFFTLARYTTGRMSAEEEISVRKWIAEDMCHTPWHDDTPRLPSEFKDIWARLPEPPSSEKSLAVELFLVSVSKVYEQQIGL